MAEHQTNLRLDVGYESAPAVASELRTKIAAARGSPLGERVEVSLRNERCALRGVLELRHAPDYPWDGRQALQLAVARFAFSSREVERWTVL